MRWMAFGNDKVVIGAGFWREGGVTMKETHYEQAPDEIKNALLKAREVEDFLPPPELLIPKEDTKAD